MKFKNNTITETNSATIKLIRGEKEFPLLITALPSNTDAKWEKRGLVAPKPKKVATKNPDGKWNKDEEGSIIYSLDYDNPVYEAALDKYLNRLAALRISLALRNCSDISFDTPVPADTEVNSNVWLQYLDALHDEVFHETEGFTYTEGRKIQDVSHKLDGRLEVDGALKGFLDPVLNP